MAPSKVKSLFKTIKIVLFFCVAYAASAVTARYLQIEPLPLVDIVLFVALVISAKHIARNKSTLSLRIAVIFVIFSILFSISLVLGFHIVTSLNLYFGTAEENYISPYSAKDIVAFLFMVICIYPIALALFLNLSRISPWLKKSPTSDKESNCYKSRDLSPIRIKFLLLPALLIFFAWTPYFLIYCPGLLFGDSWHSVAQAIGEEAWNNHHPVVYSFFIKCCIKIGNLFTSGTAAGRAIYSIIQMICIATCFAYMVQWLTQRFNLKKHWKAILITIFALTPYIASYSIAMWKDPMFSVAIMVITLLLADLVRSRGKIALNPKWLAAFTLVSLFIAFLRSNGVFVIALIGLACFILFIRSKMESKEKPSEHTPSDSDRRTYGYY